MDKNLNWSSSQNMIQYFHKNDREKTRIPRNMLDLKIKVVKRRYLLNLVV